MLTNIMITISSDSLKKFFYTTDRYQEVIKTWQNPDFTIGTEFKRWLGANDWVACVTSLPYSVTSCPEFPDGIIMNKSQNEKLLFLDYIEIPNPEPQYQSSFAKKF